MLSVAIGLAAGVLSGLLGVGGGIILVPAMVYLLHLTQHEAHGTSLAVILCVVVLSAGLYSFHGQVDWIIAVEFAIAGVLGAIIGAKLANFLSGGRLRRCFSLFLIVVAARMLWDVSGTLAGGAHVNGQAQVFSLQGAGGVLLVLAIGMLTGILSGLFGVGGGIILVPAMIYLLGMTQRLAQGISLAVIIPVSLSGSAVHYRQDNVRVDVWKWLVTGGVMGSLIGALLAQVLLPVALRGIFALLLLVLGVTMSRARGRIE